jgi:small conductance mechanosensitive channel
MFTSMDWQPLLNWVWALGILCAGWAAGSWLTGAVGNTLARTSLDPLVRNLIKSAVFPLVLVVAIAGALERLGTFSGGVIAILGTSGLAISLALQGSLSNVASGAFLLTLRPFHIGDEVEVDNVMGRVTAVGLFAMTLETEDGQQVTIINNRVAAVPIRNHSRSGARRVDVVVTLPRRGAPEALLEAVHDILRADVRFDTRRPASILFDDVTGEKITLRVRAWTTPELRVAAASDLRRSLISLYELPITASGAR